MHLSSYLYDADIQLSRVHQRRNASHCYDSSSPNCYVFFSFILFLVFFV